MLGAGRLPGQKVHPCGSLHDLAVLFWIYVQTYEITDFGVLTMGYHVLTATYRYYFPELLQSCRVTQNHCRVSTKSHTYSFSYPQPALHLFHSFYTICESLAWNFLKSFFLMCGFLFFYYYYFYGGGCCFICYYFTHNAALLQIINSCPSLTAISACNFGTSLPIKAA